MGERHSDTTRDEKSAWGWEPASYSEKVVNRLDQRSTCRIYERAVIRVPSSLSFTAVDA